MEETLLILQENQGDFLLELVNAVSKWMFSGLDLLQGFRIVHLRLEKSPFSLGNITYFASSFFNRFPMRPSSSTPQGLQPICHPSKFISNTDGIQGIFQVKLSFQIDRFLTGLSKMVILNQ